MDNSTHWSPDPTVGEVTQTLTFHRNSYVIDASYEVTNTGTAPIAPSAYFQLARDSKPTGIQTWGAPAAYTGPVLYNEAEKYKKLEFSDIDKGKAKFVDKTDNGWVGMVEHYFVAAWLPSDATKISREFYVNKVDNLYYAGVKMPLGAVAPGAAARVSVPLYVGPQEQDTLKSLAPARSVVDYGSSPSSRRAVLLLKCCIRCSGMGVGDHRRRSSSRRLSAQSRQRAIDAR